jgi:acyl-coenzyme A thioesterase 13
MSSTSSQGLQEFISAGSKDIQVSHISGNLSDDAKRRSVSAFTYFVSTVDKSYGASVGQRLKPLEMNVWKGGSAAAYGETVFEITVDKGTIWLLSIGFFWEFWFMGLMIDMCNVFGTLHGACAAYIIDPYVFYSSKVFL